MVYKLSELTKKEKEKEKKKIFAISDGPIKWSLHSFV